MKKPKSLKVTVEAYTSATPKLTKRALELKVEDLCANLRHENNLRREVEAKLSKAVELDKETLERMKARTELMKAISWMLKTASSAL